MSFKDEFRIETMRGRGPGGQHRNKTNSAVRVTHLPTGIVVTIDGRKQHRNRRDAIAEVRRRLHELQQQRRAASRKHRREEKIRQAGYVRTYHFGQNLVTDHRTGKSAPIKAVLRKGRLDLLS